MDYIGAAKEGEAVYEISRSRFIARIAPVESVEAGLEFVKRIKTEFPDATHHPFAVTGTPESGAFRLSDDGEPQGTSGQPILNVLKKKGLYNTVIVVTRYFGGIKLGAGGLVQAYSRAATMAAESVPGVKYTLSDIYELSLGYPEFRLLGAVIRASKAQVFDVNYAENVTAKAAVPLGQCDVFKSGVTNITEGKEGALKHIETKYFTYTR